MKFAITVILLWGFMFLDTANAGKAKSMCPEGWFFFAPSCYGYFTDRLTWADAEFDCTSYGVGGHLASIHNDREAEIIAQHLTNGRKDVNVWIGGNDPRQNGRWKWTDGSMFDYKPWSYGEPNNIDHQEYCLEFQAHIGFKTWNDIRCDQKNYFVCKYKP
uniref:regenerating islet-derived protein 4-like n=1 Tax=Pristiophorus japonicus TaxID=55135 RepID=UPI00398E3B5C